MFIRSSLPLIALSLILTGMPVRSQSGAESQRPPNIVLIMMDDMGYADIGSFGAKQIRTPHMDRLAREGTRFRSFYVSQAVCTASRASLLKGCYANRVGLQGALNHTSTVGLHADETTLAELCRARGYATAIFGKWKLVSKYMDGWELYVLEADRTELNSLAEHHTEVVNALSARWEARARRTHTDQWEGPRRNDWGEVPQPEKKTE